MTHVKDLSREVDLFSVKAWYFGEGEELEKLIGFGFYNHIFVSNNGIVRLYYDKEEAKKFEECLNEVLTEDFFDDLCDEFFTLCRKINDVKSDEDIFKLSVKMWPSLTIFDEISKYPEYANERMLRRLIRVRSTTENLHYKLEGKRKGYDEPKNYIFFRGELYSEDFEIFKKREGIVVEK